MSSFNTPDESVQDTVAQLINQAANTDVVYNDANDTLTVSLTDSVSVNTLEADDGTFNDSITDPAGTQHTTELAESADLVDDHANLTNVQSDQHHGRYSDSEAQNAVTGNVDAADLVGDSGTNGQLLQTDGTQVSWVSTTAITADDTANVSIISKSGTPTFTALDTTGKGLVAGMMSAQYEQGWDVTVDGQSYSASRVRLGGYIKYESSIKIDITGTQGSAKVYLVHVTR